MSVSSYLFKWIHRESNPDSSPCHGGVLPVTPWTQFVTTPSVSRARRRPRRSTAGRDARDRGRFLLSSSSRSPFVNVKICLFVPSDGFEPPFSDPESDVLPLDEEGVESFSRWIRTTICRSRIYGPAVERSRNCCCFLMIPKSHFIMTTSLLYPTLSSPGFSRSLEIASMLLVSFSVSIKLSRRL